MDIQFFAATDVGRQREHNEDNFLVDPKLNLFVVADGMGGHAAGEVASRIAVHELARAVRDQRELIERFNAAPRSAEAGKLRADLVLLMERAVQLACTSIFRASQADAEKRGMATTTCALLIAGDRGFIAHVGDSRIYLLRGGQVHQITEDHSLINELVRRGRVKRDEIEASPYARYKNAVTRAVGAHETVEVDTLDFDVLPGDQFLLCSDGLYAYFKDGELPALMTGDDIAEVPRRLVNVANGGGGHDNITAVVVRLVPKASSDEATARASDLANRVEVLRNIPLFKHLNYKEIIRVLNTTTVRDYKPGEPIIVEGAAGDELFIILGGKVRLHKGGTVVASLQRGAHFGEMALVDRSPRSASATAEEPTRMLQFRRRDFYDVIRKEPELATKLLWSFVRVLTDRLRKTTADLSGVRQQQPVVVEDLSSEVFEGEA